MLNFNPITNYLYRISIPQYNTTIYTHNIISIFIFYFLVNKYYINGVFITDSYINGVKINNFVFVFFFFQKIMLRFHNFFCWVFSATYLACWFTQMTLVTSFLPLPQMMEFDHGGRRYA